MSQIKILLVEDEGIVAMGMQARLEDLGYAVLGVAASGEDAVRMAGSSNPDLVLMDIKLKGRLDGILAAEQIRRQFDIPVVYLTSYADEDTLRRAKLSEPFGYVLKPVQERELQVVIEVALYKYWMENKHRQSETHLRTVLQSIGDAVVVTGLDGRIQFMNRAAERLVSYREGDALGRKLDEIWKLLEEGTDEPIDILECALTGEEAIAPAGNLWLVTGDDGKVPVSCHIATVRDDLGKPGGLVLVCQNHSHHRQLEEDRLKVQRLESINILARGIAHDFNNVLTGVLKNIDMAKSSAKAGDPIFDMLEEAEQGALQARDLARQLNTFALGDDLVRQEIDLTGLITERARSVLKEDNIACEFSIADDLWVAHVDTGQFGQVIDTLITNAGQAMPGGGTITIRLENVTVARNEMISLRPGKYVKLSVIDGGMGIPERYLDKVFEPYFSLKPGVSGLGLPVVYYVVRRHGGHVTVESEVGKGTVFHVYLPASGEKSERESAKALPSQPGRILVVDDEETVRYVAGKALTGIGYEVEFASNSVEAIDKFRAAEESNAGFDVVIMDLTIPGNMGGREAMEKINEINSNAKGIVSSGYSEDMVMAHFMDYGFCAAISKPFRVAHLRETVQRVLTEG